GTEVRRPVQGGVRRDPAIDGAAGAERSRENRFRAEARRMKARRNGNERNEKGSGVNGTYFFVTRFGEYTCGDGSLGGLTASSTESREFPRLSQFTVTPPHCRRRT